MEGKIVNVVKVVEPSKSSVLDPKSSQVVSSFYSKAKKVGEPNKISRLGATSSINASDAHLKMDKSKVKKVVEPNKPSKLEATSGVKASDAYYKINKKYSNKSVKKFVYVVDELDEQKDCYNDWSARRVRSRVPKVCYLDKIQGECVSPVKEEVTSLLFQSAINTAPQIVEGQEVVTKDPNSVELGNVAQRVDVGTTCTVDTVSVDSIFNRDYLYPDNSTWSVSAPRFAKIQSFSLPKDFIDLNYIASRGVTAFHALYKSNFCITIRTDATNYNQGILIMFAVPGNETVYDAYDNLNYATVLNYPHVFLNVGLENEATFEVPYGMIYDMIPMSRYSQFQSSKIHVMVWSPLAAGTSAPTTLTLSYWMRPINTYVSVKSAYLLPQMWKTMQSIIKPIAHAILDNTNIPYSKEIKGVGKVFGMYDRTLYEDEHPESARVCDARIPAVNTKFNQLEVIPDESYRFNCYTPKDLIEFARVPSLAFTVTWSTSQPAGTVLAPLTIAPSTPMLGAASGGDAISVYNATNLAGIASLYQYFRGSIIGEMVIVASSFHRGNLFVGFDPYGVGNATKESIFGLPGVSLAIGSNSNTIKFRMPYCKHKDYVNVVFPTPTVEDQIGRLYIVVQNALAAPVSVSTSVEVMLYLSAGEDAEFKYPLPASERVAIAQNGITYQSDVTEFYNNSNLEPGFIMGNHTNVLNMMRRPEYGEQWNSTSDSKNVAITTLGGRLPTFKIHRAVANLFKYNSGGIFVHIVSNIARTQSAIGQFNFKPAVAWREFARTVDYAFGNEFANLDVWQGALHQFTQSPTVNFLLPGYNEVPYYYNSKPITASPQSQGWNFALNVDSAGAAIYQLYVGHSVADDFNMYLPMSMYKLAIKVDDEELGAIIPKFTSPSSVDKFSIEQLGISEAWKLLDRSLTTYGSTTSNIVTFTVTFPVNNSYIVTRAFIACEGSATGTFTLKGGKDGQFTSIFSGSIATTIGFNEFENNIIYDQYIFQFSDVLVNFRIFEVQLYGNTTKPVIPAMTGNNAPFGYSAVGSGTISPAQPFYAFDQVDTTQWVSSSATSSITVSLPRPATVVKIMVRGLNNADGYTNYSIIKDGEEIARSVATDSLASSAGKTVYFYFRGLTPGSIFGLQGIASNGNPGLSAFQIYTSDPPIPETSLVQQSELCLIPQSLVSDGVDKILDVTGIKSVYNTVTEFMSTLKRLMEFGSTFVNMYDKFIKCFAMFEGISLILSGVMNVMSETAASTAVGLTTIAFGISKLTSPVERNDGLFPQLGIEGADTDWYTRFLRAVGRHSEEAARMIGQHLSSSHLLRSIEHVLRGMGFQVDVVTQIYEREAVENPRLAPMCRVVWSFVLYILYGNTYTRTMDLQFACDVNAELSEMRIALQDFKMPDTAYRGNTLPAATQLKAMRESLDSLRARSVFVRNRTETTMYTLDQVFDKINTAFTKGKNYVARPEPVSAYFFGDPGVGKTLVTMQALPIVLNHRLRDNPYYKEKHVNYSSKKFSEHFPQLVHVMATSESLKFDSLYNHQPFIILDDAFTERTAADAAMLTRLLNAAPFEVAKADLSDKGDVYDSPFVFCTSNEMDPVARAGETINSGKKVLRRIGPMFLVKLRNPERKYNPNDVPITANMDMEERQQAFISYCDEIYAFEKYEYKNEANVSVGTWNFSRVCSMLEREFTRKCDFASSHGLDLIAGLTAQGDTLDDTISSYNSEESNPAYEVLTVEELMEALEYEDFDDEFELRHASTISLLRFRLTDPSVFKAVLDNKNIVTPIKEFLGVTAPGKTTCCGNWRGMLKEMRAKLPNLHPTVKALLTTLITAGSLYLIKKAIYALFNAASCQFQSLIYDNKVIKDSVKHIPRAKGRLIPQVKAILSQADMEITAKIRKNIVQILWMTPNGTRHVRMHAFFLNANTILVNKHFFDEEAKMRAAGCFIYLTQPGFGVGELKMEVVAIPFDQRKPLPSSVPNTTLDLVCCTLGVNWPNISKIDKFLYNKPIKNKNALLLARDPIEDLGVVWSGEEATYPMGDTQIVAATVGFEEQQTEYGDCGRVYYVPGVGVVGLHCAISQCGTYGAATVLPSMQIATTPYRVSSILGTPATNGFWSSKAPLYEQATMNNIPLTRPLMRTTQFELINDPTFVTEEMCDYAPTAKRVSLRDGILTDPAFKNAQKWETNKVAAVPLRFTEQMTAYFINKMGNANNPRALTVHETINGFGAMVPLNMKTSPGIWADYFKTGKKEIFNPLPQRYGEDNQLLPQEWEFSTKALSHVLPFYDKTFVDVVNERDDQIRHHILPDCPYICTLKDELRSKAKVEACKTRVFEQSSLDFVLLCRKYFGHFIDSYKSKSGFTLYHGIGRDVDVVWKSYAEGLQRNSVYGHSFDYKNFDGSVPKECYSFFRAVTDAYYADDGTEEQAARHTIIHNLQNSIHILGKFVFESTQGNKSGNAFTDVFNSISNTYLIWLTFLCWQITHKDRASNLIAFDENVRMLTYGDDIVMTVKMPLLQDGYNAHFIRDVLDELGVTITSADKDADLKIYSEFSELTFLKRPFVYDENYGIWRAPLPIPDIIKELKYRPGKARNNSDDIDQRIDNVTRFSAHHTKEVFNSLISMLKAQDTKKKYSKCFGRSYEALSRDLSLKQSVVTTLY